MASTEIEFQPSQPKRSGIRGKWDNFTGSLYDSNAKTFLGRTASSWAKITLFYLVYYMFLAGFFAVMLAIFFQTLEDDVPKQTDMNSLIKGNPGMGFRPMPDVERTLIKFNQGGRDASYKAYVDEIEQFLDAYEEAAEENEENMADCSGGAPNGTNACRFDRSLLGDKCIREEDYGYKEGQPCVLLKLNKVYGWEPEPYDNETVPDHIKDQWDPDHVTVTCEGENNGDVDNMGQVEFYPANGFIRHFFPFKAQKGYQSPLVFARFKNPKSGVVMQIWCKAWAANIYHHKNDKAGSVHFELLID